MRIARKEMPKTAEVLCRCGEPYEVGVDWFRYRWLPFMASPGFSLSDMMKHAEGKHLLTKYHRFKGQPRWHKTNWLVYQLKELYYHWRYRTK